MHIVKSLLRPEGWRSTFVALAAGFFAACTMVLIDAGLREDFVAPGSSHWLGAVGLYGAFGACLGLALRGVELVLGGLRRLVLTKTSRRTRLWLGAGVVGAFVGLLVLPTASATFSGAGVRGTALGKIGTPFSVLFVLAAASVASRFGLAAFSSTESNESAPARRVIAAALLSAAIAILIDRTVYVSLYEALHSLLEGVAVIGLLVVWALVLRLALRKYPAWRRGVRILGPLVLVWFGAFVTLPSLRASIDRALTHAWLDEVYVGRMLRRAYEAEAYLKDPHGAQGIAMLRVNDLKERFEITNDRLSSQFRVPPRQKVRPPVRATLGPLNILVFYVDTLRNDVAHDPTIMPNTVRFAESALDFRRAYATGSDTLRSLPGLTGGNYNLLYSNRNDLCQVAERSGYESSLFIARSAREFLGKLRPKFKFDKEVLVPDHDPAKQVWGYGADRSTASRVVDEALEYLKNHPKDRPFFSWVFHFDQHNWREIEETHVAELMTRYSVPEEGLLNSRYRAVASSIDAEFQRLLEGLERLGLDESTAILFVSDHGEGLGRGGFWVHSVFLWEPLIRVPLMLRVPKLSGKVIERAVSLVDVAPTLAPLMEPGVSFAAYHGDDLLWHLEEKPFKRRLPILFAGALKDELVRVGMLAPDNDAMKLVVRLEAAMPELYDVLQDPEEEHNLADSQPERTRALLRSIATTPLFPRSNRDFQLLDGRGSLQIGTSAPTLGRIIQAQ